MSDQDLIDEMRELEKKVIAWKGMATMLAKQISECHDCCSGGIKPDCHKEYEKLYNLI
jgi:hypothetical protein